MQQVVAVPSQMGPMLKGARRQANLSQDELARRMGISQSRMSHMELNPGSISLEQLLELFGALGLELQVGTRPQSAEVAGSEVDQGVPKGSASAARSGRGRGLRSEW